jgi:hypothetical protein
MLAGCAIALAPKFGKDVFDGLTQANEKTLTLFASVSSGAQAGSFASRETTYNELIGTFEALRIETAARPQPAAPPFLGGLLGGIPDPNNVPKDPARITRLDAPTPGILATIVSTLTTMRDTDKTTGFNAVIAGGFKREFVTSIDQALVYEKALER